MQISPTRYKLRSFKTGTIFEDTGWLLDEPGIIEPSLIRAEYDQKQIILKGSEYGLFTYSDWLPVRHVLVGSSVPVTYKSEALARHLNLDSLYITFSGWWPEKEAYMNTCSFKETEAYTVCSRLSSIKGKILVVASAGNTARAFAKVCSDNDIPLLLCVPEDNLDALWFENETKTCVKLISSRKGSDYFDAIHLSNLASQCEGFIAEGGAKNVARRDGMATTMLSAATKIGHIPEYYFQAVGSGTGAIAAWEANLRLIADGRYGNNKAKLMLSQNYPFTPIKDAWDAGSRAMLPIDDAQARQQVETIDAKVLSNRKPPYPIPGGLFDAMQDAGGEFMSINNEKAEEAAVLFEKLEGCDIHPAAAVAVASLIEAVKQKRIENSACIMLNITGGGEKKFTKNKTLHYLKPSYVFDINTDKETVEKVLNNMFFQ